jgi:hypothetical protein
VSHIAFAKSSQPTVRCPFLAGATRAEYIMCYRARVRRVESVIVGPDAAKSRFWHAEGHPERHGKRAFCDSASVAAAIAFGKLGDKPFLALRIGCGMLMRESR